MLMFILVKLVSSKLIKTTSSLQAKFGLSSLRHQIQEPTFLGHDIASLILSNLQFIAVVQLTTQLRSFFMDNWKIKNNSTMCSH